MCNILVITVCSCVKYLSKNTLKYYLSSFDVSVLYFTLYIFDNFYFYLTTFLKKIMYFLLHMFFLTLKNFGLTTIAGALMENVKKNRYRDILPYDQTRVPLTLLTNENDFDYINASFIKGATKTKKYIATQGPLRHTLVDFWRMIWQYDVKKKCERYWTTFKETTHFGPFIVSNVSVRQLNANHVLSWPDHDVPYTVSGILGMMDMARKDQENNASPVLIHCSAGCGRTGVICALDYVHDLLVTKQIKEDFSIMKIVVELRRQRPSAVQTKEQYQFVFSAVAYMFEKALRSAENNSQNLTKVRQKLLLLFNHSIMFFIRNQRRRPTYRAPRPHQQKMNDVYAVVNKSKQLPPPASSTAPLAALHYYDNEELGVPKCHVGALYSMVKSRCPPAKPPPAVAPIYDTAGLANHRLAEASAVEDQSGYDHIELFMWKICTPGSMGEYLLFNCRIKKPKGPRDPPAEWSRVER
uniref:protein-tyrosine-phosphatase n=1 Tax=Salmo trutta TaxID=8032 RepID=A0A674EAH8_SALTR